MNIGTEFEITFFSNKDKKTITRNGVWDFKCRFWKSKAGDDLVTYYDKHRSWYRTAKTDWDIRVVVPQRRGTRVRRKPERFTPT